MNLLVVLLILLILAGGAVGPWWPHSASWGYFPSGIIGLFALILILRLLGLV